MRIALIGYGKMGKTIEKIALQRQHTISYRIDWDNADDLDLLNPQNTDIAIEFTTPESAPRNLRVCLESGVPVVCGSTGWLDEKPDIEEICHRKNGTFFYASNFSIGVNLFFRLNEYLAKMINSYPQYDVRLEEIHHTQKKDAPSGTAITIAEGILENFEHKKQWVLAPAQNAKELEIRAFRENEVVGTHTVLYESEWDTIEIKHTAHKRESFALGAVLVAEWLQGRKGVLSMADFLGNFK